METEKERNFEDLRKKAMTLSFYKYGPVKANYETEKTINCIGSIKKRIEKYVQTGNIEFLVDIANFAMIEYMYPQREKNISKKYIYEYALSKLSNYNNDQHDLPSRKILTSEYSLMFDSLMASDFSLNGEKYFLIPTHNLEGGRNTINLILQILDAYDKYGGCEKMIYIANLSRIEFYYSQHQNAYYKTTVSKESPGVDGFGVNEVIDYQKHL